jgi:peptide subunit release factor RF-3
MGSVSMPVVNLDETPFQFGSAMQYLSLQRLIAGLLDWAIAGLATWLQYQPPLHTKFTVWGRLRSQRMTGAWY